MPTIAQMDAYFTKLMEDAPSDTKVAAVLVQWAQFKSNLHEEVDADIASFLKKAKVMEDQLPDVSEPAPDPAPG